MEFNRERPLRLRRFGRPVKYYKGIATSWLKPYKSGIPAHKILLARHRKDNTGRVFPNLDGTFSIPMPARVYHKSRMPKVMFHAVVARPRPEYDFDGKIGIWAFTLERLAKRSCKRTGTVAGETVIIEDVKVNAEVYREKVVGKGGVFEKMREKMWSFHKDSGEPQAGKELYYQHDGARVHDTYENHEAYETESRKKGFWIIVIKQCAQSPDFNMLDLAFFRSLQSDVMTMPKSTRKDIITAVFKCFAEYDAGRMEMCSRSLITVQLPPTAAVSRLAGTTTTRRTVGSEKIFVMEFLIWPLQNQLCIRQKETWPPSRRSLMRMLLSEAIQKTPMILPVTAAVIKCN